MTTRSRFPIFKALFWMLILMTALPVPSSGQDYPTRPVEMIVGYAPGGAGDVVARLIAEKLTVSLGK